LVITKGFSIFNLTGFSITCFLVVLLQLVNNKIKLRATKEASVRVMVIIISNDLVLAK